MQRVSRKVATIAALLLPIILVYELAFSYRGNNRTERYKYSQALETMPEDNPPPLSVGTLPTKIEIVVINPFQSANVASQVGGLITRFHFDEGDFVEKGQVVCELDDTRYRIAFDRARERVNELQVAVQRFEEEAQIKQELLDLDVTTRLEAAKANAEFEMAQFRLAGAQREFDMARLDLDSCKVKAPFSGYISTRQKQPDESVDKLQPVFSIVDSSQVYAVAHVPSSLLSRFPKGVEAEFLYGTNSKAKGKVERIAKVIDPKSKTKRVYLLIDNSDGNLEVGMTGSMQMVN
jgi:RND family efflux transporter MFP subunit